MKDFFQKNFASEIARLIAGMAVITLSFGYMASLYIASEKAKSNLEYSLNQTTELLQKRMEENTKLIADLNFTTASKKYLEGQVGDLSSTVDVLQKYAKTDKQLLEKYSKVYFLNENYVPESLSTINAFYQLQKDKSMEFHAMAYPYLEKLLNQARANGMDLLVASAYRSYGTQSSLKSSYKRTFGTTAANSFSADQGYSEHQLGTAVDFTNSIVGGELTGFEKTKEYKWLQDNAYLYGFILSYPSTNSFYVFEPWHWRFVGTYLASHIHVQSTSFYDMDQREINEYLVKIFDQN